MSPTQKIQITILLQALPNFDPEDLKEYIEGGEFSIPDPNNIEECLRAYEFLDELGYLQDARSDFREGEEETKIQAEWSRHYETKSVAAKMFDGSWVGWTYWYGGGKHGEPEAMDWMGNAYDLGCEEKEELVINRYFTKK